MANDKAEPVKAKDTQAPPSDSQVVHLPNLLELAGGFEAGLKAARNTLQDKAAGIKQLGEQTANAMTGATIFSKASIDALAPKEHEHAQAYTTNWYFEQAGSALPLVAAVAIGHKFLGALGTKEALEAQKTTAEGASVLKRAASLSLRQTPLGLSVRNAAAIGFASEFANPTDTKNNDSLLSSLGTRTVDGSIGAISMASMTLGTIGTQAAFKAVGKVIFKEAAVTAVDSAAIGAETGVAKVSQNVFAKATESTLNRLKVGGTNAIIAGIGSVPGGGVGYLAGAEIHGKEIKFSDLAESAVGSGVVGGMFGAASSLRGNPEAAVKSDKTSSDTPSTPFSARFEGATQAVRDLVFGRQGDAGQLGTAMASDAKGRSSADFDKLAKSWEGYLEFAGHKGRVEPTDVEHILRGVDNGSLKSSILQEYADGNNSAEQKAFVAASLRPESRAAFLKMMEVSRDGSAAAQNGFVKDVSADKQTIADLQMMATRLNDPRLTKLVEAAATPIVEPAAPLSVEMPDLKMAASPGSTPIDFDAATNPGVRVKTKITDEALRQPVANGFVQLLDAAKTTGTPEQMAAFFRAVDANPKILDGVKEMANQTNLQSVKDLAAMSEKPALRQAVSQLLEAAQEGGSAAQRQVFIDIVNNDRSTIPDLKKLAERYNDPRLKELVRAADVAPIDLVVSTQKEVDDLKSATKVVEKLIQSGGKDTTELNKIIRDDDSLASLQPYLRHIAERLGGEEIAKKVDEAYAGRYETREVTFVGDSTLPRPKEVQSVSVRSNQVHDFVQMTETAEYLHDLFTVKPKKGDPISNPDWIYNLLKVKAQSESGKAVEGTVKEYAKKTFDPRFQAIVNDAYLPREGIVFGPERIFQAANEEEQKAFGEFATVMKSWPKVAAGETPTPDAVLDYRSQVLHYLAAHQDLHEMVRRYGQQTNSSFEAGAIDLFYATKNLERFPGVLIKEAAPPVESAELRGFKQDPIGNLLVNGSISPELNYVKAVAEHLGSPPVLDTPHGRRLFNDQPRVSQEQPVAGAGTWSVTEFNGHSVATITGHPENLQSIEDSIDGRRAEIYGRSGETAPYSKFYYPNNVNVKVVNPGVDGSSSRFKIEFPLQGNYISTDFPPDSKVAREISLDGNLTQINRDGSVSMQKIADFKNFDPVAYDNARKVEAQARETEQRQVEAKAASAKLVEVMSTAVDPAVRLEAAKALKPENMSVEQFQSWLQFAFRKSPRTGAANYHELDNNASALETMRPKFVSADYDAWSARLKDYLAVPEAAAGKVSGRSAYPEWLARENADALPNWLKGDIYQRFNAKDAGASERMPAGVADYFKANGEPKDVRKGRNGRPDEATPFRPIGDDSVGLRMDRLSDLNMAKPEVTARLMELGAQDGRALQDVIKQMTNTRNNNVEFRNLLSVTLPNAKDIYSVKVMLDALDKARAPYTPEAEKGVDLELARRAAAALSGNAVQASAAKDLVSKLYKGEVTRPPFAKGPKPGPFDTNMLANYTLAAPETAVAADIPDELIFGSAVPKAPEPALADTDGDIAGGAPAGPGSSPALDALRGTTETPPAEPLTELVEPTKPPAPEPLTESVEPSLPPAAEVLAQRIGESLTESGKLGENTVFQTSDGRDYLIEPSGEAYERLALKHGGELWKNVNDQTEIWTDTSDKVWNYNSENNTAVARDVPEGVTRQVLSFGHEGVTRQVLSVGHEDSDANRNPDTYVSPREKVLSTFRQDGSVEFAYEDGSKHIVGARTWTGTDYLPAFESYQYPGADGASGLSLSVNANKAITGTLPNGATFSAANVSGKGTIFTYPDGVAPYEAGATVSFDNDTLTINETSGKQTVFHRDGFVEEHLPQTDGQAHEEPEVHSPALDQLDHLAGDNP